MRRLAIFVLTACFTIASPANGVAVEPKCSRFEVRALIRDFIEAYNRGDVAYLDQIWAQEPRFFWYFVDTDLLRRGPLSQDRASLGLYFTERSAHADQLRLRDLSIAWERGWHGAWDITFKLVRTSDEAGAVGRYHGKAAATCQRLHAWAMGRET